MPIRFRRTFKIFPGVRINVSKGGVSTTIGPRGFRFTFNKHGIRRTIGLPGTGVSATDYVVDYDPDDGHGDNSDPDRKRDRERRRDANDDRDNEYGCFPWGCLTFVLIVLVGVYFGARSQDMIPADYLSQWMERMAQSVREAGY